jgi:hypothetical protein
VNIKSIQLIIAALSTNIHNFSIPNDDYDDSSEDEESTSNLSNQALTCLRNKKNRISRELNISAFTILPGYAGGVEGVNRSDLDSHADASVVGKEALLFNDFYRKATVSGYDPDGEKNRCGMYQPRWDMLSHKLETL